MELEKFNSSEEFAEQKARIINTEQLVVKKIWEQVPSYARVAYDSLEKRFEAGYDVTSFSFWEREKDTIRNSTRGLNAKVRQTYVEDAFAQVIGNLNGNGTGGVAPLFAKSNEPLQDEETILSIYKFEQELLKSAIINSEDQARQDVIKNVVEKDALAVIGLSRPEMLLGGVIITDINNDTRQIVVPTIMSGVAMRFHHPIGAVTPIVEFVLNRVA